MSDSTFRVTRRGSGCFILEVRYQGKVSEVVRTLDSNMMLEYLDHCFPRGMKVQWIVVPRAQI